jgi:hypothetical protein
VFYWGRTLILLRAASRWGESTGLWVDTPSTAKTSRTSEQVNTNTQSSVAERVILCSLFIELTAKSRIPPTFVFSYAVIKNCNIIVLWLLHWHLFSWQIGLPSAYFLSNDAPGGMSLFIYMHSFSCIILLHLPVVFCIGILLRLCVSSGFSCTCHSPAKYLWFEPFFGFADILAIQVVFTQTSCWFSQYPYPSPYLLVAWGLLTESSKRICSESCFFWSSASSSVLYICTLYLRVSQYIANWRSSMIKGTKTQTNHGVRCFT